MRYRRLGNTGLRVSEIGFGTIPVLRGNVPVLPSYFNLTEEEALDVLKYAWEQGCNLFDTAIVPEYGDAELKLGKFAAQIGREHLIISDKARFFTGEEMYGAVVESCKNLGTDPDIYFVHQVDEDNQELTFGKYGALDALAELKAENRIRFVGVASHYYSVLWRAALDERVDVLQGSGNILERGMLERIYRQQNSDIFLKKGFLLNKVYAAGILPAFFPVQTLVKGALSYPVSCALIGLGTKEQVEQVMKTEWMEREEYQCPSWEQVIASLEKSFDPIPCDRCQRCHCVYGTEIHILFRQYNYYFLGKNYWALRKLDLGIRESASYCRDCLDMPCLKQCPKKLKIPHLIQNIACLVEKHMHNSVI